MPEPERTTVVIARAACCKAWFRIDAARITVGMVFECPDCRRWLQLSAPGMTKLYQGGQER